MSTLRSHQVEGFDAIHFSFSLSYLVCLSCTSPANLGQFAVPKKASVK